MKQLFRFHRGGFQESLDTTVEVSSHKEIETLVRKEFERPDAKIAVRSDRITDTRLPANWPNSIEFMVTAYFPDTKAKYPIGYVSCVYD